MPSLRICSVPRTSGMLILRPSIQLIVSRFQSRQTVRKQQYGKRSGSGVDSMKHARSAQI